MKLTVLGKYGPFPKENGGTSSYLLRCEGKNILLDAGESSFSRLIHILPPEKLDAIVLTHSHFDHICDTGVFIYYFEALSKRGENFKKPLLFCYDDGSPIIKTLLNSPFFEVKEISLNKTFDLGGVNLGFSLVKHPAVTHAVTIKSEGKIFVYTGDTNLFDGLYNLVSPSDAFLADGGLLEKDWKAEKPHLSVGKISELSKKCANKSIISHLNPLYTEEEICAEAEKFGGNFVVAKEGETYEI